MGVTLLVGAQYGSEGKGVIAHHLADDFATHVRVGGPNAGHSFVHDGVTWRMRSVPCGFTNKQAHLVIGRGAVVDVDRLWLELKRIGEVYDPMILSRVTVDRSAIVLTNYHRKSSEHDKAMERYGSTQEGVGPARVERLLRRPGLVGFIKDYAGPKPPDGDTVKLLNEAVDSGVRVLVEGTQGYGLSLYHGDWPFVTSADTSPAQLLADCGLSPRFVDDIVLVARTYPIRVGGNSGPMYAETSWEEMSARLELPVREFTTVTGRLRRVGEWDESLFKDAVRVCRPTMIALTFLDYKFPAVIGMRWWNELPLGAQNFVLDFEQRYGVLVGFVGTGGDDFSVIDRRHFHGTDL